MNCDECVTPNLFDCYQKKGKIEGKCLEILVRLEESKLKFKRGF
jgi:hypothetical protein